MRAREEKVGVLDWTKSLTTEGFQNLLSGNQTRIRSGTYFFEIEGKRGTGI